MQTRWIFAALALALPFAVYAWWRRRQLLKDRNVDPWPFTVLWLVGVILAAETLLLSAWKEGESRRIDPPGYERLDPP